MKAIVDSEQIEIPLSMSSPFGSLNCAELQQSLRDLVGDPIIQRMADSIHEGDGQHQAWRLSEYLDCSNWSEDCRRREWREYTYHHYQVNGGQHAISGGGPMIAIEIILQYLERERMQDDLEPGIPV